VHVQGKRAYQLARAGEAFELTAREVVVHTLQLVSYEYPHLQVDVSCGSGMYIRSLARDIGHTLGVGGYCTKLIRTEVGPFSIDRSVPPERLNLSRDLLKPLTALPDMEHITADETQIQRLAHGNPIAMRQEVRCEETAIVNAAGDLLAIATVDREQKYLRPMKVFCSAD